jgi:hypothetical protein
VSVHSGLPLAVNLSRAHGFLALVT